MSQVRDVVLVMCIFSSGALENPRGSGFWKGEYMGKGMEQGRSVYEQPGTKLDRILSQQGGFQVSKREQKGIKEEWKRKAKSKGSIVYSIFMYIMNACNV